MVWVWGVKIFCSDDIYCSSVSPLIMMNCCLQPRAMISILRGARKTSCSLSALIVFLSLMTSGTLLCQLSGLREYTDCVIMCQVNRSFKHHYWIEILQNNHGVLWLRLTWLPPSAWPCPLHASDSEIGARAGSADQARAHKLIQDLSQQKYTVRIKTCWFVNLFNVQYQLMR